MNRLITYTILSLFWLNLCGQDNMDIESLQLNSSPAYVVIGVEPENIQRPNSPMAFVAGVKSAVVNGKMQPNFAMETSPYYWGKKKPDSNNFNANDFIFGTNFGTNLLRSITLSFATSSSDTAVFGNLEEGTALGFGVHIQLVQGKPSAKTRDKLHDWYRHAHTGTLLDLLKNSISILGEVEDLEEWLDVTLDLKQYDEMPNEEKTLIKVFLFKELKKKKLNKMDLDLIVELKEKLEDRAQNALTIVNKFPLTREGFMLEFSAANARLAQNSEWGRLEDAKTSIWITPSYRFNTSRDSNSIDFIDLMAVTRLTINSTVVDSSNYLDIGGKLQWIHNRLSLSGELIYRALTKKPESVQKNYTFRSAISLSYKVTEQITFQATFGSNFDGNSTTYSDPSKMFALGGFNFGFNNLYKN